MQTIFTKYCGPTDTKGERIKAVSWMGTKWYPYSYGVVDPNTIAAKQHIQDMFDHQWGQWEIKCHGEAPRQTNYANVYVVGFKD